MSHRLSAFMAIVLTVLLNEAVSLGGEGAVMAIGPLAIFGISTAANIGLSLLGNALFPRPKIDEFINEEDVTIGDRVGQIEAQQARSALEGLGFATQRAADTPLTGTARAINLRATTDANKQAYAGFLARIAAQRQVANQFDAQQRFRLGALQFADEERAQSARVEAFGSIGNTISQLGGYAFSQASQASQQPAAQSSSSGVGLMSASPRVDYRRILTNGTPPPSGPIPFSFPSPSSDSLREILELGRIQIRD